ncbi:MAG: hypothetical protein HY255_06930 [Betaproteobacteria bacterium]|nr:hypothetical protein [Betaproteobacteria bacterium]
MQLVVAIPDQNQLTGASAGRWVLFDAKSSVLREGEGEPGSMPLAERIVAVVPVSRMVFIETALPSVGDAKRDALLRYAIEDKLTIDPATVHAVVLGRAQGDATANLFVVAAIDRAWLHGAIDWLAAADRTPHLIVPGSEGIAAGGEEWRAVLAGRRGFAKRPDGFVYGFDTDASGAPPFALSLALREMAKLGRAPAALAVSADGDASAFIPNWSAALGVTIRPVAGDDTTLRAPHWSRLRANSPANLLQGEFVREGSRDAWLQALRPALYVLAAMFALQWMGTMADWWRLDRQRKAALAAQEQLFREAFPQAQTIVDAPLQMQRNVATLRLERGMAAGDAARMQLARLARIAASEPQLKIKSIEIDARTASLQGEWSGAALPAGMRERVIGMGAELESAGSANGVQGVTIRLKAAP